MDGKENFKKMLQDMIGDSVAQDMDEAGKQLARATRGYYTALIDEGLLEVWISRKGEPTGWHTADDIIAMMKGEKG